MSTPPRLSDSPVPLTPRSLEALFTPPPLGPPAMPLVSNRGEREEEERMEGAAVASTSGAGRAEVEGEGGGAGAERDRDREREGEGEVEGEEGEDVWSILERQLFDEPLPELEVDMDMELGDGDGRRGGEEEREEDAAERVRWALDGRREGRREPPLLVRREPPLLWPRADAGSERDVAAALGEIEVYEGCARSKYNLFGEIASFLCIRTFYLPALVLEDQWLIEHEPESTSRDRSSSLRRAVFPDPPEPIPDTVLSPNQLLRIFTAQTNAIARDIERAQSETEREVESLERQQQRIRQLMSRLESQNVPEPQPNPDPPMPMRAEAPRVRDREALLIERERYIRNIVRGLAIINREQERTPFRAALAAGRGGTTLESTRRRILEQRLRLMRSQQDRLAREFQRFDEELSRAGESSNSISTTLQGSDSPLNTARPGVLGRNPPPLDVNFFLSQRGRDLAIASRERLSQLRNPETRDLFRRRMMALLRLRQGFADMEQVTEELLLLRQEEEGSSDEARRNRMAAFPSPVRRLSRTRTPRVQLTPDSRTSTFRRRRSLRPLSLSDADYDGQIVENENPVIPPFLPSPVRDLEEDEILERLQSLQERASSSAQQDLPARSFLPDIRQELQRRREQMTGSLPRSSMPVERTSAIADMETRRASIQREDDFFSRQLREVVEERRQIEEERRNRILQRPSEIANHLMQIRSFFRLRPENPEDANPPAVLDQDQYENWVNAFQPASWRSPPALPSRESPVGGRRSPRMSVPDDNQDASFNPQFDSLSAPSPPPVRSSNPVRPAYPFVSTIRPEPRASSRHFGTSTGDYIIVGEPVEGLPSPLSLRGRRFNFLRQVDLEKEPVYDIYCGNQFVDADDDGENGSILFDRPPGISYEWRDLRSDAAFDELRDPMWKGKGKDVSAESGDPARLPVSGGCGKLLCARGMRIDKSSCGIIAAPGHFRTTKKYFVTDAPPCGAAGLGRVEQKRDGLKCKTEKLCCVECGNEVGFRILQNCHICQASRETTAFFYFLPRSVTALPRPLTHPPPRMAVSIDAPICSWASIPSVQSDFRDGLVSEPMHWIGGATGGDEWIQKATTPRAKKRGGEFDDRSVGDLPGSGPPTRSNQLNPPPVNLNISEEDVALFREAQELARLRRIGRGSPIERVVPENRPEESLGRRPSSTLAVPPQPLPLRSPPATPTPLEREEMQRRLDAEPQGGRLVRSHAIRLPRVQIEEEEDDETDGAETEVPEELDEAGFVRGQVRPSMNLFRGFNEVPDRGSPPQGYLHGNIQDVVDSLRDSLVRDEVARSSANLSNRPATHTLTTADDAVVIPQDTLFITKRAAPALSRYHKRDAGLDRCIVIVMQPMSFWD
ncbi:hypothetical protein BT69DRAFT_1303925 [Atractiella rhizophila]|nr:hypothetical protein BT69DRAFT_1303925 [Atractiella rhizophila]